MSFKSNKGKRIMKNSDLIFIANSLKQKMVSGKKYSAKELAENTFYSGRQIAYAIVSGLNRKPKLYDFISSNKPTGCTNSSVIYEIVVK